MMVESLGTRPPSEQWQAARSGIRNAEGNLDALRLAVEEGGVAATQEAIEALLATVDRTTVYLDHVLVQASEEQGEDRPGKKRKGNGPYLPPQPRHPHHDQLPADLPEPHGGHDRRHPREGTPFETTHRRRRPSDLPVPPPELERHDSPGREGEQRLRRGAANTKEGEATPFQILRAQQILERLLPFLEQDIAAVVAEAHGLLFSWTTALWGAPILLVENDNDNLHFGKSADPRWTEADPAPEPETPQSGGALEQNGSEPRVADSQVATQAFWAPSPVREPARLSRQSSHRRRRLHALFLGSQDDDSDDHQNEDHQ